MSLPFAEILSETVAQINALSLGGAGTADVYVGRVAKTQHKKLSINVYVGDPRRAESGTGFERVDVPVHIHVVLVRTDTIKGANLALTLAQYVEKIDRALHFLRPTDLIGGPLSDFHLTESSIDDIDTETGSNQSTNLGVDQTAEAYLTVTWQFYRSV